MAHFQATFVGSERTIDYTPGSAVTGGQVFVIGSSMIAIAKVDIAANQLGGLDVEGLYDADKDASVFAAGDNVYWNPTGTAQNPAATAGAGTMTSNPLGAIFAGRAVQAQLTGDNTVRVLLLSTRDPQQIALIPVAALAADASLTAENVFVHPLAVEILSVGFLAQGASFGTISNADTSVFTVAQTAGSIVVETYNTANQPTGAAFNPFGALTAANAALPANTPITLAIANGTTAATPAGLLVVRYRPTNS
jgi:predicted RecA/RadA family phage recombinase